MTDAIAEKAIQIRQAKKVKLADAIIAATAIIQGGVLATDNTKDFEGIDGLQLINPLQVQNTKFVRFLDSELKNEIMMPANELAHGSNAGETAESGP